MEEYNTIFGGLELLTITPNTPPPPKYPPLSFVPAIISFYFSYKGGRNLRKGIECYINQRVYRRPIIKDKIEKLMYVTSIQGRVKRKLLHDAVSFFAQGIFLSSTFPILSYFLSDEWFIGALASLTATGGSVIGYYSRKNETKTI